MTSLFSIQNTLEARTSACPSEKSSDQFFDLSRRSLTQVRCAYAPSVRLYDAPFADQQFVFVDLEDVLYEGVRVHCSYNMRNEKKILKHARRTRYSRFTKLMISLYNSTM